MALRRNPEAGYRLLDRQEREDLPLDFGRGEVSVRGSPGRASPPGELGKPIERNTELLEDYRKIIGICHIGIQIPYETCS